MDLITDIRCELGECVLWCDRTERLLWTDILEQTLWSLDPRSGETRSWPMPERLASFALTSEPGRLLLGLASRLAYFDMASGATTPLAEVEPELSTTRVNDGRCDRAGRFVFGTLNEGDDRRPIGSFYRLNADLTLERLPLPKVAIANSICFSPDGAIMYYCDSLTHAIRCCDYVHGCTGDRLFVRLPEEGGEPDGSAIDADGYLWNAEWGAARVVRYAPDGSVERVLAVAAEQPSCVAFGGPQLDRLFATSALVGLDEPEVGDGALFVADLSPLRGLPESRFQAV